MGDKGEVLSIPLLELELLIWGKESGEDGMSLYISHVVVFCIGCQRPRTWVAEVRLQLTLWVRKRVAMRPQ
jgi:hypothetical protein